MKFVFFFFFLPFIKTEYNGLNKSRKRKKKSVNPHFFSNFIFKWTFFLLYALLSLFHSCIQICNILNTGNMYFYG